MPPPVPAHEDLPAPPPGKTGWPWTREPGQGARPAPPDRVLPKLTIITPSFNQGHFIEETIRSVLLQGYPQLEYIVMDGGSTDATVEILRKYDAWIGHWVSERDSGQTDALNKGLARATGEIWGFLNSDDLLLPGALLRAESALAAGDAQWVAGGCIVGTSMADGPRRAARAPSEPWRELVRESALFQPSTFYRAACLQRFGSFDQTLQFCFDHEYWCRLLLGGCAPVIIDEPLSFYRLHDESKTSSLLRRFKVEDAQIALRHRAACPASSHAVIDAVVAAWTHHEARLQVIDTYRNEGRSAALSRLASETLRSPTLLKERPSLGLVRRLLSPRPRFD